MVWKVGSAKEQITPDIRGISMLGYGLPENKIQGVETPLWARVLSVECLDSRLVFINLEICFPADSIRQELIPRLRKIPALKDLEDADLYITAQHTHSGPSGFCHYPLYNIPTPGFVPKVLESIVYGCVKATEKALDQARYCTAEFAKSEFDANLPVGFNRSLKVYLRNPEVEAEGLSTEPAGAMDRNMYLMKFTSEGRTFASMNWFGVHGTSVPNYNTKLNGDNKGYAADFVEKQLDSVDTAHVALFNQSSAADITPNFIWDRERKQYRGQFENYIESAMFNGKLQAQKALELLDTRAAKALGPQLFKAFRYVDMSKLQINPKFLAAYPEAQFARPVAPALGTAFMVGTDEGPGAPKALGFLVSLLSSLVKFINVMRSFRMNEAERKAMWDFYNGQNPKHVFIESGNKKILGFSNPLTIPVPDFIDPMLARLRQFVRNGSMQEHSWTQQVLPVHLLCMGHVAIVGLPAEVTTISALRIRRQVLQKLESAGITEVVVNGYTNSYCGYITTPEEYLEQNYEAGHTVFGRWTLPGFQTVVESLCEEILGKAEQFPVPAEIPVRFSAQELAGRTYQI